MKVTQQNNGGPSGPVRVAVVGAGIRGRMYAAIISQLHNGELVGICDTNQAARETAERELQRPTFDDTAQMCSKTSPDAVVIATPDFAHVEPAVTAAKAGAHLLIEKPLATNTQDGLAICRAVDQAGVRAMVAFENHWNGPLSSMKAAADAGELGRIVSCNSQLDDRIDVPTEMNSWLGKSSPGWFLMSHTVELAGWIAGQKPVIASAFGRKDILKAKGIDTYDSIHAVIEFDGGMVASVNSCWVLPRSIPLIFQFRHEMVGTAGAMRADLTDQMLHKATDRYEHPSTIGVTYTGAPTSPPAQMLAEFITKLLDGSKMTCSLQEGLLNTAAISAVHKSIETRKPVAVDAILTEGQ